MVDIAANLLGHLGFAVLALSYLVSDILMLRLLLMLANIFLALWGAIAINDWGTFAWNMLYFFINGGHVLRLYYKSRSFEFPKEIQGLYHRVFSILSSYQFKLLYDISLQKNVEAGVHIVRQDDPTMALGVMVHGSAKVTKNGATLAQVLSGSLFNVFEFVTGSYRSNVNLISETECKYLVWEHGTLGALLKSEPELNNALRNIVATDLAMKLSGVDATLEKHHREAQSESNSVHTRTDVELGLTSFEQASHRSTMNQFSLPPDSSQQFTLQNPIPSIHSPPSHRSGISQPSSRQM